jgi:hypothetical protein
MEEQKGQENTSCKGSVMSRIECGEVCPRSKRFFQTRECAVWALWALSVVVGALAVAVTLFVLTHRQYALYEATHDNFLTFMVEVLPFVWIIVFAAMAGLGVYELRRTKRGYRYPLWQIVASSMVLSLAGGAALQLFGLGYATDHMLGQRMGMYDSQEKIEKRLWQNPKEGRLIGAQTAPLKAPAVVVEFEDVEGALWHIDVLDLSQAEQNLLAEQRPVRLIGVTDGKEENRFHPCGVFPWSLDKPLSREDLHAAREAFETKVHGFAEKTEHMISPSKKDEDPESPCRELPPVHRMKH